MKQLSEKHPVIFEIILIVVGFVLAGVLAIAGKVMYMPDEVSAAIGRILAGLLLFAVWNIALCFITGDGNPVFTGEMIVLACAPAIFEEVIFRGIFINNLKASLSAMLSL